MAPLTPSFARCLVLFPLALASFGCDLLKRGADADAGATAPVAPPPATPATTAAPAATPPAATAPLPTLTGATPGKPATGTTVKTDGGAVVAAGDGGPVTQPTLAIPTTLPSGIPTAIPSSIAKTLPSGFPTTLPTALPQIPPLPGQDAGKR